MKLMMKKWIMRPLTLSLAIVLTVMAPVTALADGDEVVTTAPTAEELLSDCTLTVPEAEYVFTGEEIKPSASVTAEDSSKIPEYTIDDSNTVYENNIAVGTATVTAQVAVADVEEPAQMQTTFNIVPTQATGVKVTDVTTTSFTVSCKEMPEAMTEGSSLTWIYKFQLMVYSSDSKSWETVKTLNKTTNKASFSGLTTGKAYSVQAQYVAKAADKTTYTGAVSDRVYLSTKPAATTKISAVKTGAKSMKVTWKKVARATGYIVEYSTTSSFKSKVEVKVADGAVTSKVIKNLSTNKAYFVRVRAYRTYHDVTRYSGYSSTAFTKPEAATKPSTVSRTTSTLKVKCAAAGTAGCVYQFKLMKYNATKKKWVSAGVQISKTNTTVFKNLNAGRVYKFKVRYGKKAKSGADYTYGAWSSEKKTATTPAQMTLTNAVKASSKKVNVTWKAASYGTGYQIQYASNSKFKNAKTWTGSPITRTSKSVAFSSDATCYVRIRSYVTVNGKKIYGAWSAKQSTYYGCVYASYTTTYSSSNYNRTCNLKRACSEINGTILQPGETFSFNNVVGPRTAARGYKNAIVYQGGTEVLGMGGGICQVCSTLFNAALKANFTIVERHCHSMTVHYVPLGYDAAMAGTAKTLRFTNTSGVPIKIVATCEGGYLTMKLLCNTYKKAPTVTTSVTVSNHVYTLRRYVNGKCNYTTTSSYSDI